MEDAPTKETPNKWATAIPRGMPPLNDSLTPITTAAGWPLSWPRSLRDLPDDCKREAANLIAAYLRRELDGEDPRDPAVWERLAERRGIQFCPFADTQVEPGHYYPASEPEGASLIAINIAHPEDVQVRAWAHEFAHDALHRWCPPQLARAADAYSYSGDVDEERHDIARRVEALLFD